MGDEEKPEHGTPKDGTPKDGTPKGAGAGSGSGQPAPRKPSKSGKRPSSTQKLAAKVEAQSRAKSTAPSKPASTKQPTTGAARPAAAGPQAKGSAARGATATATRPAPAKGSQARRDAQRAAAQRGREAPAALPERYGTYIAVGAFLLTVAKLPRINTSVFAPEMAVLIVLGIAGLPLLAARVMGGPTARSTTEVWAARCAAGFLAVGFLSAVLSASVGLSFFGIYQHGTGWVFFAMVAGCFGLGTGIGRTRRDWLDNALIAGAVVNAVLAFGQQFIGLNSVGIESDSGIADGILGNPVFFGALLAAALALVAPRFIANPKRWWPVLAVVGTALGISGERLPALLGVVVGLWVAAQVAWKWWQQEPERRSATARRVLTWPVVFAAGIPVTVVVGSVLARISGGTGVVAHTANSTGNETYGQRFDTWKAGLHAFTHKPLIGYGPSQFRTATGHLYPIQAVARSGGTIFVDGHNFIIEILVTYGIIGLALFLGWIVFGSLHRHGPLLGFAAVILASELAEPLNTSVTPLAFLALGAAVLTLRDPSPPPDTGDGGPVRRRGALPTWVRPATLVCAAVALLPALWLLAGDIVLQQAYYKDADNLPQLAVGPAGSATNILFPWSDGPTELAKAHNALAGSTRDPTQTAASIAAARQAISRDPTNASLWTTLAQYQGGSGDQTGAAQSARQALMFEPYSPAALSILAIIAAEHHDNAQAEHYLETSLAVEPGQTNFEQALSELRKGCLAQPITAQQPNLTFTCPTS